MSTTVIYTVDEICNKYEGKLSKTGIYRAITLKRLKAIKVGKRYIVSEKALNSFLEGNSYEDDD
jgi:excisionase family DNA binding protein